jgi:hypothetical protein
MRDNSNIELCRALCQSFAAGPGTPNSTKSLPLHFASKRWKPNKELLKLLIRRNPGAAAVFNEYGFLPLHCACATTDDLEAVQMIYDAYPEAITMKDRQVQPHTHHMYITQTSHLHHTDTTQTFMTPFFLLFPMWYTVRHYQLCTVTVLLSQIIPYLSLPYLIIP